MNLFEDHKQMEELDAIGQAKKAISHVLNQRHDSPQLAYWIAPGSQSFALLTEAAATLYGNPVAEVRRSFADAKTVDPNAWLLALERIENAGRPHSKDCDCARCKAWDGAVRALEGAGR